MIDIILKIMKKKNQITLIEIENINNYNKINSSAILPTNFRRNIITEVIRLNELVGCEFLIGKVKVKAHDLCRPCKYLQESLKQKRYCKKNDTLINHYNIASMMVGYECFEPMA